MSSERYLCFAACLQIAIKATAGIEIDQVVIANQLGIALPVGFDSSELVGLGVDNIRFASDPDLWGITPVVTDINTALKSADVLLACQFEAISTFQDWEFEGRLAALTECGKFPIVGFDYNSLLDESASEAVGHCAVVYGVQALNGRSIIEIYDPGPKQAGVHMVDSYCLYRACRRKHGGIWFLVERF